MKTRDALKEQYHAAFAMLADVVHKCPDELRTTPNPRVDDGDRIIFRPYWRIVFHAVYFTQLYVGQTVDDFQPWPDRRRDSFEDLWHAPWEVEPFELPEDADPWSKAEMLGYLAYVDGLIDPIVDALDLDSPESGIPWYKDFPKLSHELLTLRHLQGHIGQLSELLMERGLDPEWISRVR